MIHRANRGLDAVGHSRLAIVTKDQFEMLNKIKFAVAGAVIAAAMASNAAYAATATGTATVEIVTPVVLSAVTDLNFGLVAADAANAGTGADTQSLSTVKGFGGSSRGSFKVTAAAASAVVALGLTDASILLTGAGTDMTANLTLSKSSITFNSTALETVYVGGTLDVGAAQTMGTYTGSFEVTADYQ
jgi:Mat/Ecp fimbriae major subunit